MSEEILPSSQVGANDAPQDNGEREIIDQLRYELMMLRQDVMELRAEITQRAQDDMMANPPPSRVLTDPDDYLGEKAAQQDAFGFSSGGFPSATQQPDFKPKPDANPEIAELRQLVEQLALQVRPRDLYREVFFAKASANSSNGTVAFKELFLNSTGLVAFPGGRSANGTANLIMHAGAGSGAANNTILLVQAYQNANVTKYAAMTIPTWLKTTGVSSGNVTTGVVYNATAPDGSNHTCKNVFEPSNGTPGPLGINVSSNGTVGNGTCVVQPLGNTTNFMPAFADANGTLWIAQPNSAS